jgi:hypothetical protein
MDQHKLQQLIILALGKASIGVLNDEQIIAIGEQLVAKILALVPPVPPAGQ